VEAALSLRNSRKRFQERDTNLKNGKEKEKEKTWPAMEIRVPKMVRRMVKEASSMVWSFHRRNVLKRLRK
jgi:hypothetical protein